MSNSEAINEIVDKIFSLNHDIVSKMIMAYEDPEFKSVPAISKAYEDVQFKKLSDYYLELRNLIREAISISDNIKSNDYEELEDDIFEEMKFKSRQDFIEDIVLDIKNLIENIYESMKLVPFDEGDEVTESIYYGKKEETIRICEYNFILNSIQQQLDIIKFEDYFQSHSKSKVFHISSFISPVLIDAISNILKYELAEKQCERVIDMARKQSLLEKYSEISYFADLLDSIEYLRIEERYKRRFEEVAGYMNNNTLYSQFFMDLYKKGMLSLYTNFEKDEIDLNIKMRVSDYSRVNKQNIKSLFQDFLIKYKKSKKKENGIEFSSVLKLKIFQILKRYKRYLKKEKDIPIEKMNGNPEETSVDYVDDILEIYD